MTAVDLNPDPSSIPGGSALQTLVNGLAGWGLIIALGALVVGAALWAIGAHSQNYHHASLGKRTVLASAAGALLIGAAPTLVNFFFHLGQTVR
jgi:hypothetical protein